MKVSFFQTYGDRLCLLKARERDFLFLKFLKEFDNNILSLHNVSDRVRKYVFNSSTYSNFQIIENNDITYTQCIQKLVNYLNESKVEKFLFYQDDTFSHELTEENFTEFVDSVINTTFTHYNISYKLDYLKYQPGSTWTGINKEIILNNKLFKIYNTTTKDFANSGLWAMDDSSFICDLHTLNNIYDNNYTNMGNDIWSAEHYLKNKFTNINYQRLVSDISFVKNYNIIGPNRQPSNIRDLILKLNCNEEDLI